MRAFMDFLISCYTAKANVLLTSLETMKSDLIRWNSTHDGQWSILDFLGITAFHQTALSTLPGAADIQYYVLVLAAPKSRGYIKLSQTNPRDNQPEIWIYPLTDSGDIKMLVEDLKFTCRLLNTKALKDGGYVAPTTKASQCQSFDIQSDQYLQCLVENKVNLDINYHGVGSCKMGPKSDSSTVVDPELKVHDITALGVADASSMQQVIRANIHAPTVMIAEKASDLIKKSWIEP